MLSYFNLGMVFSVERKIIAGRDAFLGRWISTVNYDRPGLYHRVDGVIDNS